MSGKLRIIWKDNMNNISGNGSWLNYTNETCDNLESWVKFQNSLYPTIVHTIEYEL